MLFSYLGLFHADSPFQLRRRSCRFRDLSDLHQQPGKIFSDSYPAKTLRVHMFNSPFQTSKEIRGRIHVSKKEMLHLFGQVHSDSWHELKVRGNFSHRFTVNPPSPQPRRLGVYCPLWSRRNWLLLLQLQLPSFAAVEADVCRSPQNNSDFDYQARGKLRVERQECRVSDTVVSPICCLICVSGAKVALVSYRFLCSSVDLQETLACIPP